MKLLYLTSILIHILSYYRLLFAQYQATFIKVKPQGIIFYLCSQSDKIEPLKLSSTFYSIFIKISPLRLQISIISKRGEENFKSDKSRLKPQKFKRDILPLSNEISHLYIYFEAPKLITRKKTKHLKILNCLYGNVNTTICLWDRHSRKLSFPLQFKIYVK